MGQSAGSKQLDRLEVVSLLGRGAFAEVFLVTDKRGAKWGAQGAMYALKRYKKFDLVAGMGLLGVEREKVVLSEVSSPFVLSMVCAFQSRHFLFFVLSYMEGGDVKHALRRSKGGVFPEAQAVYYCYQIVCGLRAVHSHGMLYGDLKTDNLLLDGAGNVRLADFGRAVTLTQASGWLATEAVGTEGYQAQEMLKGRAYSFSSDLYSMGVTVYAMMVGRLPFPSRVDALGEGPPPFPDTDRGGGEMGETDGVVSEQAKDFIVRLLAPLSAGRLGAGGGGGAGEGGTHHVHWPSIYDHPFLDNHGVTEAKGCCTSRPPHYTHAEERGEPLYGPSKDVKNPVAVLPALSKQEQARFTNFDFQVNKTR
jgi:serine/threonine protein kinase